MLGLEEEQRRSPGLASQRVPGGRVWVKCCRNKPTGTAMEEHLLEGKQLLGFICAGALL